MLYADIRDVTKSMNRVLRTCVAKNADFMRRPIEISRAGAAVLTFITVFVEGTSWDVGIGDVHGEM